MRPGDKHPHMGAVLRHVHKHPSDSASGEDTRDDGVFIQHCALSLEL